MTSVYWTGLEMIQLFLLMTLARSNHMTSTYLLGRLRTIEEYVAIW
jgi:hypothetical protein